MADVGDGAPLIGCAAVAVKGEVTRCGMVGEMHEGVPARGHGSRAVCAGDPVSGSPSSSSSVAFTALTGAAIGGLAWWENHETSRALLETVMAQTARLATDQAEEFLRGAESAVRLGPELVRAGALDPDDERQLERFMLATLRAYPGHHVGELRQRATIGSSAPGATPAATCSSTAASRWASKIHLEEDRGGADDGTRTPSRRSDDHGYRPTERPYLPARVGRAAISCGPSRTRSRTAAGSGSRARCR